MGRGPVPNYVVEEELSDHVLEREMELQVSSKAIWLDRVPISFF